MTNPSGHGNTSRGGPDRSSRARRGTGSRPLPDLAAGVLGRFTDEVREVMGAQRERVLAVAPNATEVITDVGYTVSLQYGPDDKVGGAFCYIAGCSKHANLGFQGGAALPNPEHVTEGAGALMRHIKFVTVQETQAPWVEDYLEAALAWRGLDAHIGYERSVTRPKRS